jgi:hypothetical protein
MTIFYIHTSEKRDLSIKEMINFFNRLKDQEKIILIDKNSTPALVSDILKFMGQKKYEYELLFTDESFDNNKVTIEKYYWSIKRLYYFTSDKKILKKGIQKKILDMNKLRLNIQITDPKNIKNILDFISVNKIYSKISSELENHKDKKAILHSLVNYKKKIKFFYIDDSLRLIDRQYFCPALNNRKIIIKGQRISFCPRLIEKYFIDIKKETISTNYLDLFDITLHIKKSLIDHKGSEDFLCSVCKRYIHDNN